MSHVPPDQTHLELPSAQKEELERRWHAFERNPDEGEPWEDVNRC